MTSTGYIYKLTFVKHKNLFYHHSVNSSKHMKQEKSNIHHCLIFFFYDYFDVYFKGMSWPAKISGSFWNHEIYDNLELHLILECEGC